MNRAPIVAVGLAVLFVIFLSTTAFGLPMPIEFDVDTIGKITMTPETRPAGNEGLRGRFDVTKKNPDGSTMTLQQLEAFLGEDHLNWFQKVVKNRTLGGDFPGRFIDPQCGGQGTLWADCIPWYWDETIPPDPLPPPRTKAFRDPAGRTELEVQGPPTGSTLNFSDFPGGLDLDFVTCLISDFGKKKYHVLDGCFSWTATPGADGLEDITVLNKGAAFSSEFAREIFDDFGYRIPLPPTLHLLAIGVAGLVSSAAWRKRRKA